MKVLCLFFLLSPVFAEKSRFEKLEMISKVLYLIESQYYRDVEMEKLIHGAVRGMMATLDPHSSFLNKTMLKKMQEDTKGEFGGLGIEVSQKNGFLTIITPIDDTPAFKAGLLPGDRIVEINHESTIGISLEEAVERMKGPVRTKVSLGIIRGDEEKIREFVIKRENIRIRPVKSSLIDKNFMYLRLTQFQQRAAKEIEKAMKKLKRKSKKHGGVKGMVFDLRFNPGGLLDEAVEVASLFLKEGIVVSTEGRDPKNRDIRYVRKTGFKELKIPMVVLINHASASASEIVAGALQDSDRAIIMGSKSFGKGSVQSVAQIDDENGIKLTIAQYMTPTGRKIQTMGIEPDIKLDQLDENWISRKKRYFVREQDLKNHLSATIETKEEKKMREKRIKEERKRRMKEMKKKTKPVRKKDPGNDFQVVQAVNYLKSFEVFKRMKKTL